MPHTDCELVDLTAIPLSRLRLVDDLALSASVRRLIDHADDPGTRSSRMSNAGSDCGGGHLDEVPEGPRVVVPIKC